MRGTVPERTPSGDAWRNISYNYFVTARHVIEKAKAKGLECVYVRSNTSAGIAYTPLTFDRFTFHPDEAVDLAAVHVRDFADHLQSHFPYGVVATEADMAAHDIGLGSPVSVIGLFHHHAGNEKSITIVRSGNIAAMAEEKVKSQLGPLDAMLIEMRSIGGLSGSPVFANLGRSGLVNGELRVWESPACFLIGLMHGHYDDTFLNKGGAKEVLNVGIGIVGTEHQDSRAARAAAFSSI